MVEMRKDVKMDFIDAQRRFLSENGIEEEDGKILGKIMVLIFEIGVDGKMTSYTGAKKISLDWNSTTTVQENEIWMCQVTMKTNFLGYAKPIRKIEISEIIGMCGQMQNIADHIWSHRKEDVVGYLAPRIDSEVQSVLNGRISDLEAEYKGRRSAFEAELESKRSELRARESYLSLMEENLVSEMEEKLKASEESLRKKYECNAEEIEKRLSAIKCREEKLINEKSAMMSYYESQNKVLRESVERLNDELCMLRNRPASGSGYDRGNKAMSGSVVRISGNEFKCPLFKDGRYSAKINADMTRMRFSPDNGGLAVCRNGIMAVPGLSHINALANRIGDLNCKIVDDETVEITI